MPIPSTRSSVLNPWEPVGIAYPHIVSISLALPPYVGHELVSSSDVGAIALPDRGRCLSQGTPQQTGTVQHRYRIGMSQQVESASSGLIEELPSRELLRGLFYLLFRREPVLTDDGAYVKELENGTLSPRQLVEWLVNSAEWSHQAPMTEWGASLHYGRGVFIRSLPRGKRILDIGGASTADPAGGLVWMGYPYDFDELVIVDLPTEERHAFYQDESRPTSVNSAHGQVSYRYHSMTELDDLPTSSFDLVYSGQSIEHVTRKDADVVLSHIRRVLKAGGRLAIDTPNSRMTRVQQATFVDPDHKYEYSHSEMLALLRGNGFIVERAHGISYGPESIRHGEIDLGELATRRGLYDAVEDCYLLAYVCRKPGPYNAQANMNRLWWNVARPGSVPRRLLGRLRRSPRGRR